MGIETLTLAHLPAGTHRVHIGSNETGIYFIGRAATGVGIILVIGYVIARSIGRPSFLRRFPTQPEAGPPTSGE